MGPTGCGKSNVRKSSLFKKNHGSFFLQFIDNLAKSTKLAGTTLKSVTQNVLAVRIELFDANIVLLDTPGFNNTYRSDVTILELIGEWLKTA